jgi:predicted Zn-dependent protease
MSISTIFKITHKLLYILLISGLISCATNPVTGQKELMLISEAQEMEIGKSAIPSANWEFGGQYHDPKLESYLNTIVTRLWQNSERPHLPFSFHIQNTSIPNAFALPGYVAITRGLLSELENEAQFAAVIGHEIGHVMARHTAQRLSRITLQQLGLSIGEAVLSGKKGADALLTVGAIGSSLLILQYDRNQELQADRLGVKYMALLGYDPQEAIRAHEILEKAVEKYLKRLGKSRREDTFIDNLLSTHPRKEVRLNEIQAMINELPRYQIRGDGKFTSRFQKETKNLREINEIYYLYDKAENYYKKENYTSAELRIKGAIQRNNRQAPFYNLLGFIKLKQKKYPEARNSFEKAISIDAGYQPSIYGLGLVFYFRNEYQSAISQFKKSLRLYPDHPGSHFALGKSFFLVKNYRDAIPHLENFVEVAPGHPEIHGLLGICYEKTGNLNYAVREYRYQLKVAPDTELGIYAKRRLIALGALQ